jgi:hypothetical protein
MPAFDVIADTQPQLPFRPTIHNGRKTVAELKTEIQALDSDIFTDKVVNDMTYNDVVYAIKVTPEAPEEEEG